MFVRIGAAVLVLVCGLAVQAFPQTQPVPPPQQPGQPEPAQPQPPEQPPQPPAPPGPQAPQEPAPPAVPTRPPTIIVPGASVAGIRLGASVRAVQARFGAPSEVLQGGLSAHLYGRLGLVVYVRDSAVVAVSTTNSLLRVGGSLGVGHSVADAQVAFGSASHRGTLEGFRAELYDDRGVGFGIDGKAIAVIIVFRPGEARVVSTL